MPESRVRVIVQEVRSGKYVQGKTFALGHADFKEVVKEIAKAVETARWRR